MRSVRLTVMRSAGSASCKNTIWLSVEAPSCAHRVESIRSTSKWHLTESAVGLHFRRNQDHPPPRLNDNLTVRLTPENGFETPNYFAPKRTASSKASGVFLQRPSCGAAAGWWRPG